jgi:peptide/nickel transport system substrate-binding protein
MLAPKYPATYMILQQDPDWALINFQISKDATFNPFHYDDPKVDALIATVHNGSKSESDTAVKALNKYVVEQAWFAPWYRMQSSFVSDAKTKVTVQTGNAYPYLWNIVPTS